MYHWNAYMYIYDLEDAAMESQQAWDDGTDDTNFEEVRIVPVATTTTPTAQDEAIICNVQRILGRLVGKALQLLDIYDVENNNIYNDYTLLHRKLYS